MKKVGDPYRRILSIPSTNAAVPLDHMQHPGGGSIPEVSSKRGNICSLAWG